MTRIAVNGAAGRMGRTVIETATDHEDCEVVVGVDVDAEPVDEVPVVTPEETASALLEHEPQVGIDFSVPDASLAFADACAEAGVALVVGTTGFDDEGLAAIREASEAVPVLKATNFSRGIQALLGAVREATGALPGADVELVETHHNRKRDAPSGTAKTIVETVQEQRDLEPTYGREGEAPREEEEIGVFARRAGGIHGEHELLLAGEHEALTLTHRAESRGVFAAGALDAATWLAGREPGWYEFADVVGEGDVVNEEREDDQERGDRR